MVAPALSAAAVLLSLTTGAQAQPFPARGGETGIIDVPDAQVAGPGGGQLAVEYRVDRTSGTTEAGPMPLYAVTGVTRRLDVGLTLREWGQPGDPRPSRLLFGGAAKLQLAAPRGGRPGAALGLVLDRFNERPVLGARAIASGSIGPLEAAGFVGGEARPRRLDGLGATAGVAATIPVVAGTSLAAEALTGPRGRSFGLALRWALSPTTGISLGGNYLAPDDGFRVAVTLAFSPARAPTGASTPAEPPAPAPAKAEAAPGPRFAEERPRLRLRMAIADPERLGVARHLQHGPQGPRPEASAASSGTGSAQELAEAQLRAAQALRDARERRVRASSDQLDAREKSVLAQERTLDEREQELAAREREQDARAQLLARPREARPEERRLEKLEADLAAQERTLAAQARSLAPAIDAARGRERDAASREDLEGREAQRRPAPPRGGASRAADLDARKAALAAHNRRLAAAELRLVARGTRLEVMERRLGIRAQQLEARERRLAARGERLDLLGGRPSGPAAAPAPGASRVVLGAPTIVVTTPLPTAPPAPGAPDLLAGSTGWRQVDAAIEAARPSIERCMAERVGGASPPRAGVVLVLHVARSGRVAHVASGEGELSGPALDACLRAASRGWAFPPAEGEYRVDVPVSITGGQAR